MRTHGTVGTLDLYKSFTCPIRPNHSKHTKKCPIKSALYKVNRTLRTVRTLLFYIEIKRPNHDILFMNI